MINVGSVFFDIIANSSGFSKGINSAANMAQNKFSSAMGVVGNAIGVAFSAAAVVGFGKTCVQVAKETQSAWTGLSSIVNGQNKSFSEANSFLQNYVSDGLVPLNNAVTAYKNLLSRGYDTSQIESVMSALKDAAAFGRQASYSYGDAIQSATEGLKNENSVLVDNAGVTKNVAKMWEEYASSIGTTANNLTQQQKIQAEVNGIINETRWQMGDAARYSEEFAGTTARVSASLTTLKTNIGHITIPLANVFIPVVQGALNVANAFTQAVINLMTVMGVDMFDVSVFDNAASSALNTADAISSTGAAAETAAKKVKKSFAAYDEINVLSKNSSSSGSSGSSASGSSIESAFNMPTGNSSGFDTSQIESSIASITAIVSIATLAIGALLTFTGVNLPLGIALLAAGAVGLVTAIAIDWTSTESSVSSTIDLITAIVSGALLVIGAIMVLTGVNLPLGIALLAAGAVGLAATIAINWDSTSNSVKTAIETITEIVSIALLAVGVIIALSGAGLPLGIALIAAGAVGLVASVALNWNETENKVSKIITTITAVVGGALLAIGAILAFSGINLPLGIALIAAGAVTLVASVLPNWNDVSDKTKQTIGLIAGIAGGAMLALGVILLVTGAGIPLGLGLMAAGAATLATAIAPNWNFIVEKIKGICSSVASAFSNLWASIKQTFSGWGNFFSNLWDTIKQKFTSIGTTIGAAISGAFKKAVNSVFATIENIVNTPIRAINSLIGVINKVPGINLGRLSTFSLPRLAQGGWVAANNPQLAIVGDNTREGEIIAPESKIREAVEQAIAKAKGTVQTVKLAIELIIKYPDGRTIIKQINEAQIQEGKILLEV